MSWAQLIIVKAAAEGQFILRFTATLRIILLKVIIIQHMLKVQQTSTPYFS